VKKNLKRPKFSENRFHTEVGMFFIISMNLMNVIYKTKNDNIIDTLKSENW
jgi:hypothetical protein